MIRASISRTAFAAGMLLTVLGSALPALAESKPVNVDKQGLALRGYDPVAYFTEKKAVKGDAQYAAAHEGATYHFAGPANRDLFSQSPEKYLPQFGGYCAYGVADGHKADTDPTAFTVVDGKLYVNYNADVSKLFNADLKKYIAAAEKNWPTVQKQDH